MIVYLISATPDAGVNDARARGWIQIGAFRFATPNRHDVRVITRPSELVPGPGVTYLFRGSNYDSGPPKTDPIPLRAWKGNRLTFDAFVASGRGRWIESEEELPKDERAAHVQGDDQVSEF